MNIITIFRAKNIRVVLLVACTIMTDTASTNDIERGNFEFIDNSRFLTQATLGWNDIELGKLIELGQQRWLDQQLLKPATKLEPYISMLNARSNEDGAKNARTLPYHKVNSAGNSVGYKNSTTAWMRAVLRGDDLLRHRVAFALSQILVVSNRINVLVGASANYYDLLLDNAFADYETLLQEVTLHPVMGKYLSYLWNRAYDTNTNQHPDENYAREVMQLFSIGLWELNSDGSKRLNTLGEPISTYGTHDVSTLARVFTGLSLADEQFGQQNWKKYSTPMIMNKEWHDNKHKTALNGYINLNADNNPIDDIKTTIKKLADHPNTAPFISKKLIQHLVTSNPSKEYIARVSSVWETSSGNLGEVVKAILLDKNARSPTHANNADFGRLKDPLQRIVHITKAFNCTGGLDLSADAYPGLQWWRPSLIETILQEPLRAPSVFNFYDATYSAPGTISSSKLDSPEFQILNEVSTVKTINYIWSGINGSFHKSRNKTTGAPMNCDFKTAKAHLELGNDSLLDYLNFLLTSGVSAHNELIKTRLGSIANGHNKVLDAIIAISASPYAAVQR